MCGISGVLSFDGSPVDEATLSAQTRALAHRGPDGEGCWVSPSRAVGLGHRRLAIIDLSEAARQPMGLRGRFTITYNGEIYNYVEVRAELQGLGWTFATQSDTEVLLAAYAQFGEAALERLDGMFAFAIWDEREQTLFCARDRFGEKPFYYVHEVGRRFVFASEIKGLVAAGVAPRLDRRSLYQYLAFEVVQDPARADETFYEGVRSLEPAHCLTVSFRHGLARPRRYWSIPARQPAAAPGLAEAAERFLHLLDTSVKRRLRSDVPVGSSLSGGLDSSSVVCLMHRARAGQQALAQNSFSARFREPRLDEGPYIEAVVEATGTTPHVVWPDGEGLAAGMTALVRHQEEPFAGASVYAQWEVMRLAQREGTKVLLDGQGADETLAGYLHFFEPYLRGLSRSSAGRFREERAAYERLHARPLPASWRLRLGALVPGLLSALGAARRRLGGRRAAWLAPDFAREFHGDDPPFRTFDDLDSALRFFTQDYGLRTLLRYADRNSMAFGREVRLPFLAHELVEFAFSLPDELKLGNGWTKRVLREAVRGVVPEAVRSRVDKLGFEPPEDDWLRAPAVQRLHEQALLALRKEGIVEGVPPAETRWRVLMAGTLLATPLQAS
jgi:asparagine synthase (glutamine-hydrolysing)